MQIPRTVAVTAQILLAFCACAAIAFFLYPESLTKYFSYFPPVNLPERYYWDDGHYADIVLNPRCSPFFPLWPWLVRTLFHPQSKEAAILAQKVASAGLFAITVPVLYRLLARELRSPRLAAWMVLLFSLSPMAFYRVIGYSESLFSLLSCGLIGLLMIRRPSRLALAGLFGIVIVMSLCRPILIPVAAAALGSLVTLYIVRLLTSPEQSWRQAGKQSRADLIVTLVLLAGAIVGYALYGYYCWQTAGNFWLPFAAQALWDRQLRFRPLLLLFPRAPLFDLVGLYVPFIVLTAGWAIALRNRPWMPRPFVPRSPLWSVLFIYPPLLVVSYGIAWWRRTQQSLLSPSNLGTCYLFWFSTYFACIHAAIDLLTQRFLYSAARHVFGIPFVFVAVGYLFACGQTVPRRWLWAFTLISAAFLVQYWIYYGKDFWPG